VFSDSDIQAVVISAPAAQHHALATQALDAGKHCFVEKPLSLTYDEGAALVRLAEAKKKILFVGHILQYHPAVVRLKELINKGTIGRLQYIYSRRPTLVKKGATLGASCTIVCGHTIGEYAFIGAGAVVTKDIPDHALMVGNPAKQIACMCECGEKLDEQGQCKTCGQIFDALAKSHA
jgi:acetyltransferase-like isoleucine patch superfamily enzyme